MKRFPRLGLFAAATVAIMVTLRLAATPADAALRCTMMPAPFHLVVAIERDTLMPLAQTVQEWTTASSVRPGSADTLLAHAGTLMPSGRVHILASDTSTVNALSAAGVRGPRQMAFIQAQPYRADCRTIRWTDTAPWIRTGDTGYLRATLAPRATWPGNVPVFVVAPTWEWPYPRQTGALPINLSEFTRGEFRIKPEVLAVPLASSRAFFDFATTIDRDAPTARIVAWARANYAEAAREPLTSLIRDAIVGNDRDAVSQRPSRFRGSYAVTMTTPETVATWNFRTMERPLQSVREWEDVRSLNDVLASPYLSGYQLQGYAADSVGMLPRERPGFGRDARPAMVWVAVGDRSSDPSARSASVVRAHLAFQKRAAPRPAWRALSPLVPPPDELDQTTRDALARMGQQHEEGDDDVRLALTLRVAPDGVVRGDTTLQTPTGRIRVALVRIDTIAIRQQR